MTVLFWPSDDLPEGWPAILQARIPEEEVRVWPDVGSPEAVEFAILSHPGSGELGRFPNLKAVFSEGAGADSLLTNPDIPAHVPITRVFDPDQAREMSEWTLYMVLHFHRLMHEYAELRAEGRWQPLGRRDTHDTRVGVLGLGIMGDLTARRLAALEFPVTGWSRSPKEIDGVPCLHGAEGFQEILDSSDILVCGLALTPETSGIINADALAAMPRGSYVVNMARGGHVVEKDLFAALESGHIAGAGLDVFEVEPPAPDHPCWTHPRIVWTPHIAGFVDPETAAEQMAENIRRARGGEPLLYVIDRDKGY